MVRVDELKALSYAVRNRRGYKQGLNQFGADAVERLRTVGFINTGHTLKSETYSITKLGDCYYKDLYGLTSYYLQRLSGFLSKLNR